MKLLFNIDSIDTINDKVIFLKNNNIALWDVLSSCNINNSLDSSIKNIQVNDISYIVKNSQIKHIFLTGKKAYELYQKYCYPKTKIEAIYLPSTSSANCKLSLEELLEEYSIIKKYL